MKKVMAAVCAMGLMALAGAANGQVTNIKISQVYGGGGVNATSTYTHDYVELYNKGDVAVDLTGTSIQYASSGSTSNFSGRINLTGTIAPRGYFLVRAAPNTTTNPPGAALPAFDVDGTVTTGGVSTNPNFSGTNGKVAFVNGTTLLNSTSNCQNVAIIDLVGYGTASCFEGTGAAPAGSNSTALFRAAEGCTDTGNNNADFFAAAPAPRSTQSPTFNCPSSTPPSGIGSSSPELCAGASTVVSVAVTQGANPASPITGVTMDTTSIGGGPGELMYNDGTNGDVTANDNTWSATVTVFSSQTGARSIPMTITDQLNRQGIANATVNVAFCGMSGFFSAEPVCTGGSTLVTFVVNPAQGPTSTGITATADLSSIGGSASQQLFDDGTNGDVTAGDNTFSYLATGVGTTPGAFAIAATAQDAQARNVNRNSTVFVGACTPADSTLVISAIYGAGGNAGSNFAHDYVEIFNRSNSDQSLDGLSIQYASGETDTNGLGVSGATRMYVLPSGVTLAPGQYYLVKMAGGTGPVTVDTEGGITMSADRGTIALVNGTAALGTNSCGSTSILDMVGYGYSDYTANPAPQAGRGYCREGDFHAPTLNATTGLIRRNGGCWDTNNNGMDFVVYTPAPRNTATTPAPCGGGCPGNECGPQDYNGDGDSGTDQDIEAFFACLGGTCCETCFCQGSDFNGDGDFGTDQDIEAFFRVLGGNPC
ncbi:MAG TPA: lamin tail domain-containing protein [Phycisphaerales bacterium]|nr:lamin tail domain-containing protein [Phycisphaerales bacterium]